MSADHSGEADVHSPAAAAGRPIFGNAERWRALGLDRLSGLGPPAAAAAILLGAMAVLAASPTLFVADHWPDIFIALDAALHWAHGHRPHEDFHSPLGAAYIALMGVTGSIAGSGPHTLIWANIAVAACTAAPMLLVTLRRLNSALAAAATLYWTLLALSPRRLAGGPEHLSWAGAYNKWGFALVAVLWLAAAIAPRRSGRRPALAEAALLGAVLCFLFYLKLTYFAAGLAPFLFRALFLDRGHERRLSLMPVVIGLGMIVLAAVAGGVSLPGYARDILMAANSSIGIAVTHVSLDLHVNALLFGVNLALYLIHYRAFKGADPETAAQASRIRSLFLALLILALAVNNQNTSIVIPLLAVPPLVLAAGPAQAASALPHAARLAMVLIPAGYFLWWSAVELRAVAHHHLAARREAGAAFCLQRDNALCRMRITDTRTHPQYGMSWADTQPLYEELHAVLDPMVTPQSRIVQIGFANTLNARYGLEPARGGLLFWHYLRNFDNESRPDERAVFADATLVVMARTPVPNSNDPGMAALYGAHVRRHFTLAARTPNWEIYRRP